MMIVVPAFAERDEREDQAVAAVVIGLITAFADEMRERVDARGRMKQNRGADEKTPDQKLIARHAPTRMIRKHPMAGEKQSGRQQDRHERVEAVQENELGKFREIAHLRIVGWKIASTRDPADVRPPKAPLFRRMHIMFIVGMLMMMTVLIRPPKRPALHGGAADHGKNKLCHA